MIFSNVSKTYGNRLLFSGLTLEANSGLVEVKGKSGCGKTTLFRILTGVESPDTGMVDIPQFAYCGQDNTLFPEYSLKKNIKLLLGPIKHERLDKLVAMLGFGKYLDHPIIELSGGERQKAEFIFCTYQEEPVYFFDEPFSSLDERSREIAACYLKELSKERVVFLINHDAKIASLTPDWLINFEGGAVTVKQISRQLGGNSCLNPDVFKKSKILKAMLLYRFKSLPFISFLRFALSFCCVFLFSLGCAFTCFDRNQSLEVSLSSDPFDIFDFAIYQGENEITVGKAEELSKEISENAILSLTSENVIAVGALPSGSNAICYGADGLQAIPKGISSLSIENSTFKCGIEFSSYSQLEAPDSVPLYRRIYDYFNYGEFSEKQLLLLPKDFALAWLESGPGFLMGDDSQIESDFLFPDISLSFNELYVHSLPNRGFKFVFDEGYVLNLPSNNYEGSIKVGDSGPRLPVTGISKNSLIEVSLNAYLLIISSNAQSSGTLALPSSSVLNLAEMWDVGPTDYLRDGRSWWNYNYWFFSFSSIFFLAYLMLVLISSRGDSPYSRCCKEINSHLGGTRSCFCLTGLLYSLVECLAPAFLCLVLYPLALCHLSNLVNAIYVYGKLRPEGFYYYSIQPSASYYDSLTSPLPFASWSNVALFVLLIGLALGLCCYFLFVKKDKENRY